MYHIIITSTHKELYSEIRQWVWNNETMLLLSFEVIVIISWIIFFLFSMKLFHMSKRDMKEESFSELGCDRKYGRSFNVLLVVTGLSQLLFLIIFHSFVMKMVQTSGRFGFECLIVTTIMGICEGIFTLNRYPKTHPIIGAFGFVFACIGWVTLGKDILTINLIAGEAFIVFGLIIPFILIPAFIRHRNDLPAMYESIFFLSAFVTDILLFRIVTG